MTESNYPRFLTSKERTMRNLILSTLSTIALLICPLSLSSQNSFSLSLDLDNSPDDQAVATLIASPDQVIAIQIFGRDIQNATGVSPRFEYNASEVTYQGFFAGNILPNAQVLSEHGTNPTFVQVSMVSFSGSATVSMGLMGTIHFRTTRTFSNTTIRLTRAILSRDGQFETISLNVTVSPYSRPLLRTLTAMAVLVLPTLSYSQADSDQRPVMGRTKQNTIWM